MVKIIAGTYGGRVKGVLTAITKEYGPVSLDKSEEERLVKIGVAEYVNEEKAEAPKTPKNDPPKQAGKGDSKKVGKVDEEPKQNAEGDDVPPPDLGGDTVVS